ncbi:MAG: arabinan endo-1,5-alpha-L-arabinosidase [Bacteroidales bacterium]|nr:arabinan endo-1,5-alpha-L-arabinosidase [Bacteroidales bacterium]
MKNKMYREMQFGLQAVLLTAVLSLATSCEEEEEPILKPPGGNGNDTTEVVNIDFSKLTDTYWDVTSQDDADEWGIHNVHDPVIRKFGNYFYCYSTDVGFGINVRLGHQIRRSENLVEWEFVGWVFESLPPKGKAYIESIGATPNNSLWAPSVVEVDGTYRLYYSLASNIGLKSCIGLAISDDPQYGWKEVDVVVGTNNTYTATNGIDPSVIITSEGEHWMTYGSSWDGIYLVQLDPSTGLTLKSGDRGKRIAHRGFTGGKVNGNIEGPELIYQPEFDMYYLFIAYDWLSTKYNVRVGRSEHVEGPYFDMSGNDLNVKTDNYPMIIAPYRFDGHSGWQGVGHCTVFDDDGQYYIAHQARPGENMFFMNLHVRQLFWTEDGWPVASPERYAAQPLREFDAFDIIGEWEMIDFGYRVVPGFDAEQTSPDFQTSEPLRLNDDWTINDTDDKWEYNHPWLRMNLDGKAVDVHVSVGRDWENFVDSTLVFTGNNRDGMPLWAKKIVE